jgi:hypothetical protein
MPSIAGGVVGEHEELDFVTCSEDALHEDAGAELDVIVMAADKRESQHSLYSLVCGGKADTAQDEQYLYDPSDVRAFLTHSRSGAP